MIRRTDDGALMHDRPLHGFVEPDDRHFGRIDDGCRGDAAELAEAGHRDGGPEEFIARRLVAARALGQTADFSRLLPTAPTPAHCAPPEL